MKPLKQAVYSSRTADKFVVRFLDGMRERVKTISDAQHRSMNSQIISWMEMCLTIEEETGKVLNIDTLHEMVDCVKHTEALEAMLQKLLNAGAWYASAIEFDSHDSKVDGEVFEKEIKALLAARGKPSVSLRTLIKEFAEMTVDIHPGEVFAMPPFVPLVNNPVRFDGRAWILQSYSVHSNDDIYAEITRGIYGNPGHDTKIVPLKDLKPL